MKEIELSSTNDDEKNTFIKDNSDIIKVNEECDTTNKELLNFNHLYLALRDFPTEEYGFFLWRFGVFALSLHRKQEVKPFND